jgi:hypothetical protein
MTRISQRVRVSLNAVKTRLAPLALLVPLVACGHHAPAYDNAAAVASAAHCVNYHSHEPELYASDAGACTYNGHPTSIQWFTNADQLDQWWNAAASFGGPILRGDNWAIECDDKPDCDRLAGKLGGTRN